MPLPSPTRILDRSHMVWPNHSSLDQNGTTQTCADRPLHAAVFACAVSGFLLLSISRTWPALFRSARGGAGYVEIALEDREETSNDDEIPPERAGRGWGPGPRISRLLLVASVCALTVRIELFRRIYQATECTASSVEVMEISPSNRGPSFTDS